MITEAQAAVISVYYENWLYRKDEAGFEDLVAAIADLVDGIDADALHAKLRKHAGEISVHNQFGFEHACLLLGRLVGESLLPGANHDFRP